MPLSQVVTDMKFSPQENGVLQDMQSVEWGRVGVFDRREGLLSVADRRLRADQDEGDRRGLPRYDRQERSGHGESLVLIELFFAT